MQQCFAAGVNAGDAVSSAAQAFSLENLCASNVTLLVIGMHQTGLYTPGEILLAIPAYYRSLNFTWSSPTNGAWINAAFNES